MVTIMMGNRKISNSSAPLRCNWRHHQPRFEHSRRFATYKLFETIEHLLVRSTMVAMILCANDEVRRRT